MRDRDIYDAVKSMHNFGTSCISIAEAADVITLDMWYSGLIIDDNLRKQSESVSQDSLLVQLSTETAELVKKLSSAIEIGSLRAERVRRDMGGNIISWKTYVNDTNLGSWVEEHGIILGDFWRYDYMEGRNRMCDFMVQEAVKLRRARDAGTNIFNEVVHAGEMADSNPLDNIEPRSFPGLYTAWASLVEENKSLRDQLAKQRGDEKEPEKEVTPRTRNTLLLIIAALCDVAGIKPNAKGTASRIVKAVHELGCKLSDEGIRNHLKEIPEVLERREK